MSSGLHDMSLPGAAQSVFEEHEPAFGHDSEFESSSRRPSSGKRMKHTDSGRSGQSGDFPAFLDDYAADDLEDDLQDALFSSSGGAPGEVQGESKVARRVCDGINMLAERGKSLKFDPITKYFTVLDGPLFESEFTELKASRAKKNLQERVFAQMYRTYVIVQGERWGATGTVFAAKSKSTPLPSTESPAQVPQFSVHDMRMNDVSRSPSETAQNVSYSAPTPPDLVPGESVGVWVDGKGGGRVQCTLQHFLDVTGLGKLYAASTSKRKRSGSSEEEEPQRGVPVRWMPEELREPLRNADVTEALGGVWSATSKGDQAYFFKRGLGVPRFGNGDVVGLAGGVLVEAATVRRGGEGMYMVVSDDNAKWKGEPLPRTEAEEELGHWCCFLGQVPVRVRGPVRTGDPIGPALQAGAPRGEAVVVHYGSSPVIGVALADKPGSEPAVVKTLSFAGLNSLSSGGSKQHEVLLEKAILLEGRMDELEYRQDITESQVKGTQRRVSSLEALVGSMAASRRMRLRVGVMLLLLLAGVGVALYFLLWGGGDGGSASSGVGGGGTDSPEGASGAGGEDGASMDGGAGSPDCRSANCSEGGLGTSSRAPTTAAVAPGAPGTTVATATAVATGGGGPGTTWGTTTAHETTTTTPGPSESDAELLASVSCDPATQLELHDNCHQISAGCCSAALGLTCYQQDKTFAQCLPTGMCEIERAGWACTEFTGFDVACAANPSATKSQFNQCQNDATGCASCNQYGEALACYKKDNFYAQCLVVAADACPPSDWGAGSHDCSYTSNDGTTIAGPSR